MSDGDAEQLQDMRGAEMMSSPRGVGGLGFRVSYD